MEGIVGRLIAYSSGVKPPNSLQTINPQSLNALPSTSGLNPLQRPQTINPQSLIALPLTLGPIPPHPLQTTSKPNQKGKNLHVLDSF